MGLVDIEHEIDQKLYEKLAEMPYAELAKYGQDIQMKDGFHPAGYGNYDNGVYMKNGKYYFHYARGTSCD